MVRDILKFPDPLLEQACAPVENFDQELATLAGDMIQTMKAARGYGLAASQVGVLLRMFVMYLPNELAEPIVCVNPRIERVTKDLVRMNEGCLSFPGRFDPIERPVGVQLAWTGYRTRQEMHHRFVGLSARCILHEIEHLDGKLMLEHLLPAAQKKLRKQAARAARAAA